MPSLPKEQDAAVRVGEGHDAKAPVKKVPVPQESDLKPGEILAKINWTGEGLP